MLRFIGSRIIQAAIALLVLTAIVFLMSRLSGNPLALLLPVTASAEDRHRLAEALGLNRSLIDQYLIFLGGLLHGDFGKSYAYGLPVTGLIAARIPATLELASCAFALSWIVGVPAGVVAAQMRGTRRATILQGLAVFGQSAPVFWAGILLIEIFAVGLRWLPAGTNNGPVYLILPALTMSLVGIAGISRMIRSSVLENLDGDMLNFARSKGLSERVVVWKHALRNALIPALSYSGVFFATIVSSSIVVEVVFAWPGTGHLTYDALLRRDYPLIQGVVLYTGAMVIAINLIIDVLYVYIDPRVRYVAH